MGCSLFGPRFGERACSLGASCLTCRSKENTTPRVQVCFDIFVNLVFIYLFLNNFFLQLIICGWLSNSAVKRLMREAHELDEPTEEYRACPLEDNLFEWHFTVQGPPSTEFEGGVYHGRILLPPEYPMKPPNIILLTVSCLAQIKILWSSKLL